MKRTIRFKRTNQPKRRVNGWRIAFIVFIGLSAFILGYFSVRPIFQLLGIVPWA